MSNIPCATLVSALLISLPAAADEPKTSNPTPRQMAHCMMARVKTARNENYKTAFKVCREQLESASGEPGRTAVNAMNNVDPAEGSKP
jgi:hypothetical protein